MNNQRGLTLISLLVVCGFLALVAILLVKVFPDVEEYFAVLKTVNATAMDPGNKGVSVADIRKSYDRRRQIDNISSVTGADLDIGKDGNEVVISFAYAKKIPLYGPVSLMIDFEGSTAK